jgi:hypothetical protein
MSAGRQPPSGDRGDAIPSLAITPTPTITPSRSPSPGRPVPPRAYLDGGDFTEAIAIYSAIALESPGHPDALAGLNEALAAQAGATATSAAPTPTAVPPEPTPVPPPSFTEEFARWWRLLGSLVLAAAVIFALLYAALRLLRWSFGWLRELWLTRLRPLLGMPPIAPGIAVGEFTRRRRAGLYRRSCHADHRGVAGALEPRQPGVADRALRHWT